MKITYKQATVVDEKQGDCVEIQKSELRSGRVRIDDLNLIDVREVGIFAGKSFFLTNQYDWIIVRDDKGILCLVPLKKSTD